MFLKQFSHSFFEVGIPGHQKEEKYNFWKESLSRPQRQKAHDLVQRLFDKAVALLWNSPFPFDKAVAMKIIAFNLYPKVSVGKCPPNKNYAQMVDGFHPGCY